MRLMRQPIPATVQPEAATAQLEEATAQLVAAPTMLRAAAQRNAEASTARLVSGSRWAASN